MAPPTAQSDASAALSGSWPPLLRVAFRFVTLYCAQFALGSNHKTVLEKLPGIGRPLQAALNLPYLRASQWIAVHGLHLGGAAVVPHASGFGDRALDWISAALMLALTAVGTALWTVCARARSYTSLWLWLRFLLRLTLAVAMLWYGSIKVWPIQIESPSLAVLNEPVGQMSPMTLLWTLLGSNHAYEVTCGLVETLCGLLLLWRRTALAGSLLAIVIMANVVLFDLFFDVPVRLYASNLLLMAVVISAPDLPALFTLLFRRQPATLTSHWVPQTPHSWVRYALLGAELVLVLVFLKGFANHAQYTHEAAGERHPSPLSGQWHVDRGTLPTPAGSPAIDLFLEPNGRTTVRAADRTLHGGGAYDARHLTLTTTLLALAPYRIAQPTPDTLALKPEQPGEPELYLSRVPLPASYPLYERRFALFNEFGYER